MVKIESQYKPIKKKVDYWPHRKALKWAVFKIDLKKVIELAKDELKAWYTEEKKLDEAEVKKKLDIFEKDILDNIDEDECLVSQFVDVDLSGEDAKLELELQHGIFKGLELFEMETLNEAIGEALMDAELRKEGSDEGKDKRGKRVIKEQLSWKMAEEK